MNYILYSLLIASIFRIVVYFAYGTETFWQEPWVDHVFWGIIGGGVLLLPALIYLAGQRAVKAAGTSLLLVWVSALTAVIFHIINGNVDFVLWLAMTSGGVIGAYFGTTIGLRIAGSKLRLYFVFVVAAAIIVIGFNVYAMTFGNSNI